MVVLNGVYEDKRMKIEVLIDKYYPEKNYIKIWIDGFLIVDNFHDFLKFVSALEEYARGKMPENKEYYFKYKYKKIFEDGRELPRFLIYKGVGLGFTPLDKPEVIFYLKILKKIENMIPANSLLISLP